jgi:Protein of unknown function (DUF1637).
VDELEKFCAWFLKNVPVVGAVPFHDAVHKVQDVTSILLYRRDQFQVQMFACPKGTIIPEHRHPNVDTIQVYVGGNIRFSNNGSYVYPESGLFALKGPLGCASKRGQMFRVRPNDVHGGVVGEGGAVFFAVQHWLNAVKPHCVGSDYDGITMGDDHLAQVVSGEAKTKRKLTAKDAASLEA